MREDIEDLEDLYLDTDKAFDEAAEKYYWKTATGDLIPVDELDSNHIKNIVFKFGKDKLYFNGYSRIVKKFDDIRKIEQF